MFKNLLCSTLVLAAFTSLAGDLRIGIIGLDTSHVVEFTRRFNDPADKNHVPGGKVVVAFKGGSKDIPSSWNRVEGYTKTLQEKFGVKIVDSIEDLCRECDVVLLESVDGRPHLKQATPVIKAGKRLFIDKPVAGSLRDAIAIYRLAKKHNVAVYSGSSLRYYPGLQELKTANIGELKGAISTGPAHIEEHHPDLFWYGIHPVESLYTIMGQGCQTVTCTVTKDTHTVTGVWADGKVGTLLGLHEGNAPYRVSVYGSKASLDQKPGGDYTPFLREVMKFLQTGIAPVPPEETIEIYAYMEAADASKRKGGSPVKVADVIKKAGGPIK
jgi:predicted dehydrogenase